MSFTIELPRDAVAALRGESAPDTTIDLLEERPGPESGRPFSRLVTGGTERERRAAVADLIERDSLEVTAVVRRHDTATLPFVEGAFSFVSPGALVIVPDAASAFPCAQIRGTRLVLTSSAFTMPQWCRELRDKGAAGVILEADTVALERAAPDALEGRGVWADCQWLSVASRSGQDALSRQRLSDPEAARADVSPQAAVPSDPSKAVAHQLADAFACGDPVRRFEMCRVLAADWPGNAIVQLAFASACMERTALEAADVALRAAATAAPNWGAVDYERGKLSLRAERLDLAVEAFRLATAGLPWFAPAYVNLGAALGECDLHEEALEAFQAALALDPQNVQTLSNIGVTCRELGRLNEAEAALRQVVTRNPEFVFGHYNLGHTFFLQGRFRAAVEAYAAGRARDAQANPVQLARLGFARVAAGEPGPGLKDLADSLDALSGDRLTQLVQEGLEVEQALRTLTPQPPGLDELRRLLVAQAADPDEGSGVS